jgi:hypothetical protein
MWVAQEVCAAENVFIQCGRYSVTWTSFLRAVCYLHFTNKNPVQDIERVIGLEQIRRAWNRGMRPSLQHLTYEFRRRRSADARDKIYALLGLMGDSMSDFPQPDYSKSTNEVYANTTRYLITQSRSLNPICGRQAQGRAEDLHSWVPDFTQTRIWRHHHWSMLLVTKTSSPLDTTKDPNTQMLREMEVKNGTCSLCEGSL